MSTETLPTLAEIETKARHLADARDALAEEVGALHAEIEAAQRCHLARIRHLVGRAAEHHSALVALVDAGRSLFVAPKSIVIHGIRLGLAKGRGGLVIADEEETLRLIHKHHGDAASALLIITEQPDKAALKDLPAKDLAKLGCEVQDTGDVPFARPVDGAVDKLVKALLKEADARRGQSQASA